MFTDCLADQGQALTTSPRALGIRVTSVMDDHLLKANRTIVKRVPRIWRDNAYRQVAATCVDLPVGVAYRASAKLGVDFARDNREIIEGIDVIPEFNEVRELIAVAIQNASALQRKVFTTPLLTEANKRRNTYQFTKKNPRCQRGGVRGAANQNTSPKRSMAENQTMLQRRSRGFALKPC